MNNAIALPPWVRYVTAQSERLPPIDAQMFEYVLAGNGVFKRGKRVGLEAMVQIARCQISGLAPIQPNFRLNYPKVPEQLLKEMLVRSQQAHPNEILFHLYWESGQWQLNIPPQTSTPTSVQPLGEGLGVSYQKALIEVHSHHNMSAEFSTTDDGEETGFRIFGVLGTIFSQPTIRVRVGLYGNFWHIPAEWVFQIPHQILDKTLEVD
jgi:PRTRC genetic system protein A